MYGGTPGQTQIDNRALKAGSHYHSLLMVIEVVTSAHETRLGGGVCITVKEQSKYRLASSLIAARTRATFSGGRNRYTSPGKVQTHCIAAAESLRG